MSFLADQFNPSGGKPRPESAKSLAAPGAAPRYQWAVIEPDLFLGEDVLCVLDPTALKEAQAANPGLVTYTAAEIDILYPVRGDHELLRAVHRVKKHLGGWLREIRPRLSTV